MSIKPSKIPYGLTKIGLGQFYWLSFAYNLIPRDLAPCSFWRRVSWWCEAVWRQPPPAAALILGKLSNSIDTFLHGMLLPQRAMNSIMMHDTYLTLKITRKKIKKKTFVYKVSRTTSQSLITLGWLSTCLTSWETAYEATLPDEGGLAEMNTWFILCTATIMWIKC